MFPRGHILYGLIFSFLFWALFPVVAWYNVALIFFASVFIDFDHYMSAVWNSGKGSLFESFKYYEKLDKKAREEKKRGIFKKGDFHIFHTVEFHVLILVVGLTFNPFMYIFIGMFFHSLLDLYEMTKEGFVHRREFFFTNWIRRKIIRN